MLEFAQIGINRNISSSDQVEPRFVASILSFQLMIKLSMKTLFSSKVTSLSNFAIEFTGAVEN